MQKLQNLPVSIMPFWPHVINICFNFCATNFSFSFLRNKPSFQRKEVEINKIRFKFLHKTRVAQSGTNGFAISNEKEQLLSVILGQSKSILLKLLDRLQS